MRNRNVLSGEEQKLIKDFVLLHFVAAVFERDTTLFERSRLKIKMPYLRAINQALARVYKDLAQLKKSMREKNIRFIGEERSPTAITKYYVCRGYQHCDTYLWDHLRAEVELRMQEYLGLSSPSSTSSDIMMASTE